MMASACCFSRLHVGSATVVGGRSLLLSPVPSLAVLLSPSPVVGVTVGVTAGGALSVSIGSESSSDS